MCGPSGLQTLATPERIGIAALGIVAAWLLLANLGNQFLWQDEAQTALLAGTIRSHGIPHGYDGRNYFSQELGKEYGEGFVWKWHTWLSFYATAASLSLLGETTFAARLPFALFGLGTVLLCAVTARRLWRSPFAGPAAAGFAAFSVPFLILSRQCRYYSMAAFFSLLGLYAYARLDRPGRGAPLLLFSAAVLLFHTHYVYSATLLSALLLHALLCERPRLVRTLRVSAAVVLVDLPWIVWFSDVRPSGEAYWDSVTDGEKLLRFSWGYVRLLAEHFFTPWLLAIPVALALLRARDGRPPLRVSRDTRSGIAHVLLVVATNVIGISALSPLAFYRYLAPLAPALFVLAALLLGRLAERSRGLALLVFGLWIATGSLRGFLDELRHDFDGPIEGIVEFLDAKADPGDLVAISYGDLPLKFYTDLRVIGGLTGEDLSEVPLADWIIVRGHANTHADREVRERLLATVIASPGRYRRHDLAVPDTPFENREEPRLHRFRTAHPALPRVRIFERIGPPTRADGAPGEGS